MTPERRAWGHMIERCTNPRHPKWPRYGGRGIKVCHEWRHNSKAFIAYMGPRPSPKHSLDRINNDGNYEPGNVQWATRQQQQRNTIQNIFIELAGTRRPLWQWLEYFNLKRSTFERRIERGWPIEKALTTKPKHCDLGYLKRRAAQIDAIKAFAKMGK